MGEKIKVEELGCFDQVAKVIGVERAKTELFKVFNVGRDDTTWVLDSPMIYEVFNWTETPQGFSFWQCISAGINPYN